MVVKNVLVGAVTLLACVAVTAPGLARPVGQQSDLLLSQENRPETEGIPQLTSEEVRGTIVSVDPNSERVEIRLSRGEVRTYRISKADQERNRLQTGSVVTLTIRDETVIAIRPESEPTGTSTTSGTTTSGTSSSTTVIRRQTTTVQQTRPAPSPAPAAQPAPQPIRGLW